MAIDVVETEVSLTVITRDEAHCQQLTAALESRGYSVDRVS
jgi:ActR/RegA family two-component response regulator